MLAKWMLAAVIMAPLCFADTWDKKTELTVNEPVMVGKAVLQPGKYVMKLLESQSNRHIVQITNDRGDQVITTVLAIPNYRLKPTGDTAFQWWETPAGNPPAMRAWFYPGDNFGQEFVYPKGLAARIAVAAKAPVPTTSSSSETAAELKQAPVTSTQPTGEERPLETAAAPPPPPPARAPQPEPVQTAQATPPPAAPVPATPAPATLPETATPFATIGLIGLAAVAAGAALRALPKV